VFIPRKNKTELSFLLKGGTAYAQFPHYGRERIQLGGPPEVTSDRGRRAETATHSAITAMTTMWLGSPGAFPQRAEPRLGSSTVVLPRTYDKHLYGELCVIRDPAIRISPKDEF
jgi:hypothetical protein